MSAQKPKSNPPVKPKPSRRLNRRTIIALTIIAASATILLAPAIYYGNFTIQVARIVLNETTSTGQPSLSVSTLSGSSDAHSVYEYIYSIETGGVFRSTEVLVSLGQGTANILIKLRITTPAAKTATVQSPTITGAVGERSHVIYLGPSEGVQDRGLYTAIANITATITLPNGSQSTPTSQTTSQILFLVP